MLFAILAESMIIWCMGMSYACMVVAFKRTQPGHMWHGRIDTMKDGTRSPVRARINVRLHLVSQGRNAHQYLPNGEIRLLLREACTNRVFVWSRQGGEVHAQCWQARARALSNATYLQG